MQHALKRKKKNKCAQESWAEIQQAIRNKNHRLFCLLISKPKINMEPENDINSIFPDTCNRHFQSVFSCTEIASQTLQDPIQERPLGFIQVEIQKLIAHIDTKNSKAPNSELIPLQF